MAPCRNCRTDLPESHRFCPMCATPQTDEASRRLEAYVTKRAEQRSATETAGGDDLRRRLRYAMGYVAVVAGLSTITSGPGVFFLLAGLFVLPPVQREIESRVGRPIGGRPTAAAAAGLFVLGTAAFLVV